MSPFKATIGGLDISANLSQIDVTPSGDGLVGDAQLYLNEAAGGFDLRPMQTVKVWQTFDSVGNGIAAKGRLFGGHVSIRDTGNVGDTKTWILRCWDHSILLFKIVRDAQLSVTLTSGTFAQQVAQAVTIIQNGLFSSVNVPIDTSSGVENFVGGMPAVTYEGGHELGWYIQQLCATAQTILSTGGAVIDAVVTNIGSGFTSAPTVTVAAPPLGGVQAVITAAISNMVASAAVGVAGSGYTATPVVHVQAPPPGGTPANITAQVGGNVTGTTISNHGTGYTSAPAVTVGAPPAGGRQAVIHAVLSGNTVGSLVIDDPGQGYASAPSLGFSGGGGSGAAATSSVNANGITGLVVNYPGRGYTSAPTLTIDGPPSGTTATATATLTGYISRLTITNPGRGYLAPPALGFTGGGGSSAAATSTISTINNALEPAFYMGTLTTFGATEDFGAPVLYTYDQATPPAPALSFSDVPAGGRKPIFGAFRRTTDPTGLSQRRQSWATIAGEQVLSTSQNRDSQATYPCDYINHTGVGDGYWQDPVVTDGTSTTGAAAQAALDALTGQTSEPVDTIDGVETAERVLPGETIGFGWSLESIPDDTVYRVAKVTYGIEPPDVIWSKLTLNARRIGLFNDGTFLFAPPIEGDNVPPAPPSSFSVTANTYDCPSGEAIMAFSIGASPSPSAAGYEIHGIINGVWFTRDVQQNLTPSIYFPSNVSYALQVRAYTNSGRFSPSVPTMALIGTTAAIEPPPHAPVITYPTDYSSSEYGPNLYNLFVTVHKNSVGDDASHGGWVHVFRTNGLGGESWYRIPEGSTFPYQAVLSGYHVGDDVYAVADIIDGCDQSSAYSAPGTHYVVPSGAPHAPVITYPTDYSSAPYGPNLYNLFVTVHKNSVGDDASGGGWVHVFRVGGTDQWQRIPPGSTFPYQAVLSSYHVGEQVNAVAWIINQWDEASALSATTANYTIPNGGPHAPITTAGTQGHNNGGYTVPITVSKNSVGDDATNGGWIKYSTGGVDQTPIRIPAGSGFPYTFVVSGLLVATYSFRSSIIDALGNESADSTPISVVITQVLPPAPTITNPIAFHHALDGYIATPVITSGGGDTSGGGEIDWVVGLDGIPTPLTHVQIIPKGATFPFTGYCPVDVGATYTFTATVRDGSGQSSVASAPVTVRISNPIPAVQTPPGGFGTGVWGPLGEQLLAGWLPVSPAVDADFTIVADAAGDNNSTSLEILKVANLAQKAGKSPPFSGKAGLTYYVRWGAKKGGGTCVGQLFVQPASWDGIEADAPVNVGAAIQIGADQTLGTTYPSTPYDGTFTMPAGATQFTFTGVGKNTLGAGGVQNIFFSYPTFEAQKPFSALDASVVNSIPNGSLGTGLVAQTNDGATQITHIGKFLVPNGSLVDDGGGVVNLNLVPYGTSFPPTPANGDPFYRTDLGVYCFTDNAVRWLGPEVPVYGLFPFNAASQVLSATTAPWVFATPPGLANYLFTSISWWFTLSSLNPSTGYFTATLNYIDHSGAAQALGTITSQGFASGVRHQSGITAGFTNNPVDFTDPGATELRLDVTKVGSPTNITIYGVTAFARRIYV